VGRVSSLTLQTIGIVHSALGERVEAARQPAASGGAVGTIELNAGLEDAISDLASFDRIWVLFWFHLNEGWRPKVLPPRSDRRRGVLATRSPHRPNPLGLSAVRLLSIEGLTLHVGDLDILDGSPVFDIKPYVAYADAFPDAGTGWLARPADPISTYEVTFSECAETQAQFVLEHTGLDLRARLTDALALGPQPHAYRRIRKDEGGAVIATKEWRARFSAGPNVIQVDHVFSGYSPRELATGTGAAHAVHRAFEARFGPAR
jgi:tRNA-Thr(GGU) m(6)t(6)A37 methyltransferase TsaA